MKRLFGCFGDVLPQDNTSGTESVCREGKLTTALRRIRYEHANKYVDSIINELALVITSSKDLPTTWTFLVPQESASVSGVVEVLLDSVKSELGDESVSVSIDPENRSALLFTIKK